MLNYLERLQCRARLGETTRAELRRATAQYRRLALETLDDRLMLTAAPGDTFLTFNTNLGTFQVELFNSTAPQTVANFLSYVDSGAYNNIFFHRIVSGFVAQTGGYSTAGAPFTTTNAPTHITTGNPVVNEFHDSNTVGTLAMAKLGGDPNSATSEFFFNLADNSSNLDNQNGGFTVFGKVLGNGMDVINAIAAVQNYNISNFWGDAFSNVPLQNVTGGDQLLASSFIVINSITRASVVTGSVFDDTSGNGSHDPGEAPLSGFTVFADVNNNGTLDAGDYSAVTDASGNYSIIGLTTGTYTVRVAPTSGWTSSTSNGSSQQLQISTSGTATMLPFGETLVAPDAPTLPSDMDTGSSNSDEITNKSQLSFLVTGVTPGATVSVYDILNGSKLIGTAVATGTSVTVPATQALAEGLHHMVATQSLSGFTSPQSAVKGVIVDLTAPAFDTETLPDATKGTTYSTTITTVDPNSSLFSIKSGPTGMQINATTGVLTWSTANVAIGTYQVTIVSTDIAGNVSQKTYSLGVDGPPVFDTIGTQKVNQGATLTIEPNVPSIKKPLQFTVDVNELPEGSQISFDNQSGKFTWTPTTAVNPGVYHITFTVTDSLERTATSGSIAIEVNAPPVIAAINDVTSNEQLPIALPITVTDQGAVTLSLAGAPPSGATLQTNGQTSNNGTVTTTGTFLWTPSELQGPGTYTILIKATDAAGLSTTIPFQVTVNEVDSPPTFNNPSTIDVRQGTTTQVQFKATDPDSPAQQLVYSLDPGAPAGAQIDPATGVLTWAIPNQYALGPVALTVRVTEVGGDNLSVTQPVTLNVVTGFTGFDLFTTSAVSLGGYAMGLAVNPGLSINSAFSIAPFGSTLPGGLPAQAAALAQLAGIPPIASAGHDSGTAGHLAAGIVDLVLGFDSGIPHNTEGMEVELARGAGNGQGTGTPGQTQGEIQKAGAEEPLDEKRERGGSRGDSSQIQRIAPPEVDTSKATPFWGPTQARYGAQPLRATVARRNAVGRVAGQFTGRNLVPAVPAEESSRSGGAKRSVAQGATAAALVMPLLVADLPERRREAKRNRLKRLIEPLG